nr:hypothetical protein [Tanacetum cinerariifolium]
MNNKKHIINLETFRDMLHVCPRVPGQTFDELPFEAEILEFLRNTTAYKEYYAYATGVAAPKPKASAMKKRGDSDTSLTPPIATPTPITTAAPVPRKKRGDSDTSLTPPIATPTPITTAASVPRLSIAAKGKQHARATTPTEPTDVERTDAKQLKIEELAKIDEPEDTESSRGGDEVIKSEEESDEEETRQKEEESFDPIPRTPEGSED